MRQVRKNTIRSTPLKVRTTDLQPAVVTSPAKILCSKVLVMRRTLDIKIRTLSFTLPYISPGGMGTGKSLFSFCRKGTLTLKVINHACARLNK